MIFMWSNEGRFGFLHQTKQKLCWYAPFVLLPAVLSAYSHSVSQRVMTNILTSGEHQPGQGDSKEFRPETANDIKQNKRAEKSLHECKVSLIMKLLVLFLDPFSGVWCPLSPERKCVIALQTGFCLPKNQIFN